MPAADREARIGHDAWRKDQVTKENGSMPLTFGTSICFVGIYGFGIVRRIFLMERSRDHMCAREMNAWVSVLKEGSGGHGHFNSTRAGCIPYDVTLNEGS